MISVILIWLYIMLTCYIIGFAAVKAMAGSADFKAGREISYLYAGIGAVTVYAQIFSIFWKVGLVANLVLLFVCILCLICFRKQYAKQLQTLRLTITPGRILPLAALFLLFAYGSSMGVIHYDTSLYHAQSIRWIEEYGIVPGLGNLHSRLAYNSASFCLSALYSMAVFSLRRRPSGLLAVGKLFEGLFQAAAEKAAAFRSGKAFGNLLSSEYF